MKIKVKLFATLREGRGKILDLNFPDDIVINDIIEELDIPKEEVSILLVNGRDGELEQTVKEGDVLSIFPPVGGG